MGRKQNSVENAPANLVFVAFYSYIRLFFKRLAMR